MYKDYVITKEIQARIFEKDDIEGIKKPKNRFNNQGEQLQVSDKRKCPMRNNIFFIIGSKDGKKPRKFYGAPGVDYICKDNEGNRWIERKFDFERKYKEDNREKVQGIPETTTGDEKSK